MTIPKQPKIYHIVHIDRLASILNYQELLCYEQICAQNINGTTIGMNNIKHRRLKLELSSHPGLFVGQCVPFYFCPRSVMLHSIHRNNHYLEYKGGQEPIIHLQADLYKSVEWANQQNHRWAFTLSNAGSNYFEDRNDLSQLNELNWQVINATQWKDYKDPKQAEFLIERSFPWHLIEIIGVKSPAICYTVKSLLQGITSKPEVKIMLEWYY